ncbi:paeninodin family lasso peptide [Gracilibacillus oryzae]|uniref:Paeninodin family lasso peptide n=1 Tax=Gracilibacillus oryzae TaxID=1672701 RepID=A0A7C8GT37_9BACI|nr:paeninodin family lasso peptide [Gracilibacillus oryzae]KAB8133660.1 paeninodin family lasso peptide [Gracilibacillus oryzae]
MKQEWKVPQLEVLDVKQTMMGPGSDVVDLTFVDHDETVELHDS